jgi:hypothetical protein
MGMRLRMLLAATGLVAAACGGSPSTPSAPAPEAAAAPETSAEAAGAPARSSKPTSSPAQGPAAARPDGPVAPDFTLALANGEDFVLSAESKPVYLVFWAEW